MAGSAFHKSRQRRAERAPLTAHGNINLVPLVDILTSIVFGIYLYGIDLMLNALMAWIFRTFGTA